MTATSRAEQTVFRPSDDWPELTPGDKIETVTGYEATLVGTGKRNRFDERMYRLWYPQTGITSNGLYDADRLREIGCMLRPAGRGGYGIVVGLIGLAATIAGFWGLGILMFAM